MGTIRISMSRRRPTAASALATAVCVCTILLSGAAALAEDGAHSGAAQTKERGFVDDIAHWFDRQATKIGSSFKDAGVAARTTAKGAKDAADSVARISDAHVVNGRERCRMAPNGAPDCLAAATLICKGKGFGTGKSLDMTTSETCSAEVYLAGRSSGPGCRTETFVSRALCR